MDSGVYVTNCWGERFYVTTGNSLALFREPNGNGPILFDQNDVRISAFIGSLTLTDHKTLCFYFGKNGKCDISEIQKAISEQRLKVFPEGATVSGTVVAGKSENSQTSASVAPLSERSALSIRNEIKLVLRSIVDQEKAEAQKIEQAYQRKNNLEKVGAHIGHFSEGLLNAGEFFLTWLKDVDDVVSISKRRQRIIESARAAMQGNFAEWPNRFKQILAEAEKRELVQALGFDPSAISQDDLRMAYDAGKLVYEDHATQLIIKQFIKDYVDAQHALEWSEIAGGAGFEIILTALLAVVTGGVGAVASMGSKARYMTKLKALGKLFQELAANLKKATKKRGFSIKKAKLAEDKAKPKKPPAARATGDQNASSGKPSADTENSEMSEVPKKFGEIYSKAPAAKLEIDRMADEIAEMFDGRVAKAPIKSQERAMQKIRNDYGGDATRIKDLARNTIIVSPDKVDDVVAELAQRGSNVKVINGDTDPLGYSGVNSTIKTQAGIYGEVQVNTPAMIYAKESEEMARALLGNDLYSDIATKSGMPGGQGHRLYEQWRVLPASDPGRSTLEAQSKAYYESVRRSVNGN